MRILNCMNGDGQLRRPEINDPAAVAYAIIAAGQCAARRPIIQFGRPIAAIGRAYGAAVGPGTSGISKSARIDLIDPWQGRST